MSDLVLVTGGAGFIGSHLVRALLDQGQAVRVLDSLERPPHADDLPRSLDKRAQFLRGDMRDGDFLRRALTDVTTVCHLAARGGYTDAVAEYLEVNSVGTALLLEAIRASGRRVRRMLVASSMAVYGEGMAECGEHGRVHPDPRRPDRLALGQFEPTCPRCGGATRSVATRESDPPSPERPYSISKYDQERLVLSLAPELGVDAAALRYFVTYGPGQSLHNPYTGVISLFAARVARGKAPLVYEDGCQTRDFIYVGDLVSAHLALLVAGELGGRVFNVGSGQAIRLMELGTLVLRAFGRDGEVELPGRYRLGDVRHIRADCSALEAVGWRARVALEDGLSRYLDWFRAEPLPADLFGSAEEGLRSRGLVRELGRP